MRLAINAVSNGEAAGIVSAGNTGALMAMAKFVLKTLPVLIVLQLLHTFQQNAGKA